LTQSTDFFVVGDFEFIAVVGVAMGEEEGVGATVRRSWTIFT